MAEMAEIFNSHRAAKQIISAISAISVGHKNNNNNKYLLEQ